MIATLREREVRFLRHVMKKNQTGRMKGTNATGRQRIKYMASLLKDEQKINKENDLMRLAENCDERRTVIADVKKA